MFPLPRTESSLRRRIRSARQQSKRLRVEPLEQRWLLSITVNTLVDEQDGSLADGDISLRDALAAGGSNETINFDAGLDGGKILLTLGELPIKSALTVDASSLPKGLTINAGKLSRIFNIDDGDNNTTLEVKLNGLTLINGKTTGDGGGILSNENLSITSCTISGNSASGAIVPGVGIFVASGGGISARTVTVTSSTISGNSVSAQNSAQGGGISAGNATVISSTISNNSASNNDIAGGSSGGGISASNATVSFSTISGNSSNAYASTGGGGIAAGTLTVVSSTVSRNSAISFGRFYFEGRGGGIRATTLTVESSTISGNSSNDGAGIQGNDVTIVSCMISANTNQKGEIPVPTGVINGTAVTVTSSTIFGNQDTGIAGNRVTVTASTISGNTGLNAGGIRGSTVTVTSSTISGNGARFGGGIAGDSVTVVSSTIFGNTAFGCGCMGSFIPGAGGGISARSVTITSSTISGNRALSSDNPNNRSSDGGVSAGSHTVYNSIIAGNSAETAPDLSPGTGASSVTFSLIGNGAGSGLVEAPDGMPDANGNLIGGPTNGVINPWLGPLADHGGPIQTHALLPGSPAIDAGDPAAVAGVGDVPAFDQRGVPFTRVAGGRIDMGAFESQTTGDLDADGDIDRDDIDRLCSAIRSGGPLSPYDLDGSGALDLDDTKILVKNVLRTSFGDSNVDRVFNSTDLTQVFQAGEYEDAIAGNSTWGDGDWNCDGEFTTADLVVAFRDGGYSAAAEAKPGSLAIDSRSLAARSLGAEDQRAKPRRSREVSRWT